MNDVEERNEEQVQTEAGEGTNLAGLSPQIVARLEEVGLDTRQVLEDALAAGEDDFLDLPGVGPATLEAVQTWLEDESALEALEEKKAAETEAPADDSEDVGRIKIAQEALVLGKKYLAEGEHELAQEHYEHAHAIFEELSNREGLAKSHEDLAIVALLRASYEAAHAHYQQALALRQTLQDRAGEREIVQQLKLVEQLQRQ